MHKIALALAAGLATCHANDLTIIYTEIPGHPTASIPGVLDASGQATVSEFRQISDLVVSPDGSHWFIRGRTQLGSDLENIMLKGSGSTGAAFAQEGQVMLGGVPGEVYDFFDGEGTILDDGSLVFGARARGGDSSVFEKIIHVDPSDTHTIRIQMGDQAFGLLDNPPGDSGDETFGNSLNGIHMLADGTVGFVAVTISNISSTRRPALFYDDQAFLQSGVSMIDTLIPSTEIWDSFDSDDFGTSLNGENWYAQGDTEGATGTDDILVVNSAVVAQEGLVIPGTKINVGAIFNTELRGDHWYARGDDEVDNDWCLTRFGIVAQTGDEIFPGAGEHWSDVISTFTGNANGDYIVIGTTDIGDDRTDEVVVLNGETVLLREGDPVDLDCNGAFDDDVYFGRGNLTSTGFQTNDWILTDDMKLFFLASLRNGEDMDLSDPDNFTGGDSFMCLDLMTGCAADLDGCGILDIFDILTFLGWADSGDPRADWNEDGTIGDIFDILAYLADFEAGC